MRAKLILVAGLLTVVAAAGLLLVRRGESDTRRHAARLDPEVGLAQVGSPIRGGRARVLYVVVDHDGVYFGDYRSESRFAMSVLDALAKREGVKVVMFHVCETARFGDAVRFYAELDKSKYFVDQFPTIPAPPGYRLPLIGTFRKQGGWWYDTENKVEW